MIKKIKLGNTIAGTPCVKMSTKKYLLFKQPYEYIGVAFNCYKREDERVIQ